MNKEINAITLKEDATIKEAMESIDKSGMGFVLIINKDKKILGMASDGDIRKALLYREKFESLIKNIMVKEPITALKETPAIELLNIMLEKSIRAIPIVDINKTLIDVVLLSELKSIPLSNPDISNKEVEIISQVLGTPFLSIGPKVEEFEEKIADYIGVKHAIAVNSGTSGLHLCVRGLDIKDGDEIITAPFSFIASANCALFERANPVFVDIDKDNLCINADKIEEKITKKTKAILPVHIFGHPCEMDKIMEIAKHYNLAVIEDACEALGTEYKNKKAGSFGDAGVFAFYPNKQITTGEGGMIVTNNGKIADLCRSMRNQGRNEDDKHSLEHIRLGYNYRMSELSAALGVAQMNRVDEILEKRQRIANFYNKRLEKIDGIKIPYIGPNINMSWFVYVIKLDDKRFSKKGRDQIIEKLNAKGINCRNYFSPIHLESFYIEMFGYKKGDFPITECVSDSTIALPFYNNLTEEEIDYICKNLESIINFFKISS
ncbi:aminotransferase class V-fold PLP-dependent enzyme [Candidatus Parcubacteria bacterium]|nr:aminotransferase class V-fold PLP-dependent enzyme [Candidatus Parcubacteria bacterium]